MTLHLRPAVRSDIPDILRLISLGTPPGVSRPPEDAPVAVYDAAFSRIENASNHLLIVGELDGYDHAVCTMQLVFIQTLGARATLRMEMESVHVDPDLRSQGLGSKMLDHAVAEARARGVNMVQLTSHKARPDAHRFYERYGFARSHEGFKLYL